jgi:non-specific serine/threonine protein kinase
MISQPSTLPPLTTRLIGREAERRELRAALAATRLLTLVGPGGAGKTRLALQLAHDAAPEFRHGATWCDLVSVSDAAYLPQRLLAVLGVPEPSGRPALDALGEALAGQHKLLVLDNCEHLLAACAVTVQTVLQACPEVSVLATSLQALSLPEERVWPVGPLPTPPAVFQDAEVLERLGEFGSVALFVERAQQALPTFALTAQNAGAVAAICRQVDGLPLALELAAARVRMLSPAQIAERLADAVRLLTRGPGDDPRHQTLRAALEWSCGLLDEAERTLLRRLSVFAGTFTLEAAERVCAADAATEPSVLDTLTDLVDKSLVSVLPQEMEGVARYRLLEVVRQHAREKLEEAGETLAFRGRHLEWCADWALRAASELTGPQQVAWLNRLEADHDNFRAALSSVRVSRRTEPGLRLAWALWRFWLARNHLTEGRAWLEELLALDEPVKAAPPQLRARASYAAGALAFRQGDRRRAQTLAEAGLRGAREAEDAQTVSSCLNLLAILATERGELARASELHSEALAIQRAANNSAGISTSLINLGMLARQQGDLQQAHDLYAEALILKQQTGEKLQAALVLNSLGEIALFRGDDQSAAVRFTESLALFREVGYKPGIGQALNNLAVLARNRGEASRARALIAEAIQVLEEAGDRTRASIARLNLGDLARDDGDLPQAKAIYAETLAQCRAGGERLGSALALHLLGVATAEEGDTAQARALQRESLSLYHALGYRLGMVEALEAWAAAAHSRSEMESGARWWGAANAERERMRAPVLAAERPRYERALAALRTALGRPVFESLWAEGGQLPFDAAVAEALAPPVAAAPAKVAAPVTLRIFSLGPAQVFLGDRLIHEWTYTKARELLYFLLTHPPQSKAQIGLALWPDASPVQLRNIFHRTLYSLRHALGRADWITFENDAYTVNRARPLEFDADTFAAGVRAAQRERAETSEQRQRLIAQLESLTLMYRGDFLTDLDVGEWALAQREELRRLNLDALLRLGRLHFAEAQYAAAAQAYERVLAFDNYLELAHRELMRCYARQGEVGQALRHYQALHRLLRDELEAAPANETTLLYERLRRGDDV